MQLAALFSDHMVLQQGEAAPIWGWSEPGDTVTVTWQPGDKSGNAKQVKTVRVGANGKWIAKLDPLKAAAAPSSLQVVSGTTGESLMVNDVLVGEVWLCSGQSNMQWMTADSLNAEQELREADYSLVRLFLVPTLVNAEPPRDVDSRWRICSRNTASTFSAVGYFFGREIIRARKVPVGMISNAWGGTRVEAWTSREALLADDLCRAEVEAYEKQRALQNEADAKRQMDAFQADPTGWMRAHVARDPGNVGEPRGWAQPDFDDAAWSEMELPSCWQQRGVPGNGVLWFRREVDVPRDWAGRDIDLHLGACDKHDTTYFNGVQVGNTSWETANPWNVCRVYRVPGHLVRGGRNVVSTRAYSYRNCGGLTGPRAEMRLQPVDQPSAEPVALAGAWRYMIEHDFGVITGLAGQPDVLPNQNSPYALFENMLLPLAPYGLRGFLWYQGESNVDGAYHYRSRFSRMIRDWRRVWAAEKHFLFVQLANYLDEPTEPQDSAWAELREAQALALREPATGMAVAIDIGDTNDIHPKNKQEVGRRLALLARARVYGERIVDSGPVFREYSIEGDCIRVSFDHVGSGLAAAGGGELKGFAIAGSSRKFVWAKAVIDGDSVRVSHSRIKAPVAVRYAWANNPVCNLQNHEGLPAAPFRTDDKPGITGP